MGEISRLKKASVAKVYQLIALRNGALCTGIGRLRGAFALFQLNFDYSGINLYVYCDHTFFLYYSKTNNNTKLIKIIIKLHIPSILY